MIQNSSSKQELDRIKFIYDTGIIPDKGIITINAEIDDDQVERVRIGMLALEHHPVTVIINSAGGDTVAGMAIINLIQKHPHPVDIRVNGMAASMACVILQAATGKRYADPDAVLMHHVGSISIGEGHFTNAKKLMEFSEKYGERINKIMLARVNEKRAKDNEPPRTMTWWKEKDAFDRWMTPEEALELGLIDEIQ